MSRRWLVFDCNYLCYRAFYTSGGLTYHGDPTGVVFGFLRGLNTFASQFGSTDFVFCFDHGRGLREQRFSFYKEERRKKRLQEEGDVVMQAMREQVDRLRTRYLEEIGHQNVFFRSGYEADDIMAKVVADMPSKDEAILVSGDFDMLQLLSRRVSVYQPLTKTLVTKEKFVAEYGIHPGEWNVAKAIAGCLTDEIPGLDGVGEKLACKFLAGEMPKTYKVYPRIVEFMQSQEFRDNLLLVTVPYAGGDKPLPYMCPMPDGPRDPNAWRGLTERMGMASLADALDGDQAWRYVEPANAS